MLENFGQFGEVIKVQKLSSSTLLFKLVSNGDTYFSSPSLKGWQDSKNAREKLFEPIVETWNIFMSVKLVECFQRAQDAHMYSFLCSRQLHVGDLLLTVLASPGDFSNCARYQVCT